MNYHHQVPNGHSFLPLIWTEWASKIMRNCEARRHMKIASLVVLLCTAMGLTGAGSAMRFSPGMIHASVTSTHASWIMPSVAPSVAMFALATSGSNTGERLATQDEKLEQLESKTQVDQIERNELRTSIHELQIQQLENFNTEEKARIDDFNKLATRMDIAETRVVTAGIVVSTIFSAALALLLFFHIDEKWANMRNRRSSRRELKPMETDE